MTSFLHDFDVSILYLQVWRLIATLLQQCISEKKTKKQFFLNFTCFYQETYIYHPVTTYNLHPENGTF